MSTESMEERLERSPGRGTFVERMDDPHIALRSALLDGRLLPPPRIDARSVSVADGVAAVESTLRSQLDRCGLGLVTLDEPLASADLIALGERLGQLVPETDPAVQRNVESGRILHLISADGNTAEQSRQPFATGSLSLHSEGSGRPVSDQPRYILLTCLHPGDDENAAQTVLVPFAAVDAGLRAADREILDHLRYDRPDMPTVRRMVDGRPVFSFRDFRDDALDWVCDPDQGGPEKVRGALAGLLQAMYDEAGARAIRWRTGLLAVIDNTWWFHGRSAAPYLRSTRHRHLKRLRITVGTTEAAT